MGSQAGLAVFWKGVMAEWLRGGAENDFLSSHPLPFDTLPPPFPPPFIPREPKPLTTGPIIMKKYVRITQGQE